MKKKITVIGDVMIDWYLHGESSRISPEAPVPVVKFKESKFQLGGAANVANNLKHLEIEPFLIGATGNDHFGSLLKEHLKAEKIKFNLTSEKSFQTICKQRLMSSNQQLARIDYEQYFHGGKLTNTFNTFIKNIAKTDLIIVSDYGKGTIFNARKLIQSAKKLKKKILIDPKGKDFTKYKGANLITPNKSEFENIMGKVGSKRDLANKAKKMLEHLNLESLIVTLGSEGMYVLKKSNKKIIGDFINAYPQEVFDVSGAGDTTISALGAALSEGNDIFSAAEFANLAASISVSKLGTSTVSIEEVTSLETSKGNKEQVIVFTNGCFDIIHSGHLDLLKEARSYGDKLIVGLNSDKSISKLKGPERPIIGQSERKKILLALKYVDEVIIFNEENPLKLIKKLKPSILVKGADYTKEQVIGGEFVESYGGQIKLVKLAKGKSTSNIINKISF
ncbi:MAG: D-glycero-beta-D-manno-heptose 1-phosphate adenylyltransferase [Gammaproteobacteria bacterium]|nr:MAG: D-glycero-beta-D-manno-heptose 1-phosphate adenylyltransferase [Gammaproteobacteria bacterium]